MKRMFGPENEHEQLVFAIEELLADVQLSVQEAMMARGVTRSELARRFGCSPANITQLLSEGANLQLETIARIFHNLGHTCEFRSRLVEEQERSTKKERVRRVRQPETSRWTVWFRDKADEPHEAESSATAELVMNIAKNSARLQPRQHGNSNMLQGEKAA